jgi:hypothetical protein
MPRAVIAGPTGLDFRWHAFDRGTLALAPHAPPGPVGLTIVQTTTTPTAPAAPASETSDGLSEHVLSDPEATVGKTYDLNSNGEGQCVEYVQAVLPLGHTSTWRAGRRVLDTPALPIGTAVMTATAEGRYPSAHPRHAGLFMGHVDGGFLILDQWFSASTQRQVAVGGFAGGKARTLRSNGSGSNDAKLYWTIRS